MRTVISPLSGFGLDPAWRRLAARALEPGPGLGADAVRAAAAAVPGCGPDALLAVEDGDELLLALPVRRRRRRGPLPAALQGWRHPLGGPGTPLVDPERPVEAWAWVVDGLRNRPVETWLHLPGQALHGPVVVALERLLAQRGLASPVSARHPAPVVRHAAVALARDLPEHVRRLRSALGPVTVVEVPDPGPGDWARVEQLAGAAAPLVRSTGEALASSARTTLLALVREGDPALLAAQLQVTAGSAEHVWWQGVHPSSSPADVGPVLLAAAARGVLERPDVDVLRLWGRAVATGAERRAEGDLAVPLRGLRGGGAVRACTWADGVRRSLHPAGGPVRWPT